MSTQPTLVIVPGSFAFGWAYDVVLDPLRAKGFDAQALDPPCYPAGYERASKSGTTTPPDMYSDARYVHEHVEKLADEGKEVVLVGHSYGGIPLTESLKGVTKKEREQQGKKGGVVRIGYLSALVPSVGENALEVLKDGMAEPPAVDENGWMYHTNLPALAANVCSDLPPEVGVAEVKRILHQHFSAAFTSPLTHAGYKDVPVSYFFCEKDLCVTPEVQQTGIDTIEKSWVGTEREGKKVDITRVECDHIPVVLKDKQEKVKAWLEEVVKKGGNE